MAEGLVNDALTHGIIGCAMRVYTILGSGFQELIYQRAMEVELAYDEVGFVAEKEMPIIIGM